MTASASGVLKLAILIPLSPKERLDVFTHPPGLRQLYLD